LSAAVAALAAGQLTQESSIIPATQPVLVNNSVNQAWFTTKEDKDNLHGKGRYQNSYSHHLFSYISLSPPHENLGVFICDQIQINNQRLLGLWSILGKDSLVALMYQDPSDHGSMVK